VDEVTVENLRNGNSTLHIENIKFDDGFIVNLPSYAAWLNGTSGNDSSTGNSSANVMIGFAGDDTMDGLGGNDTIHGGSGNDSIEGGAPETIR
jgi:Ca2+-binding RTX toxin-like protein